MIKTTSIITGSKHSSTYTVSFDFIVAKPSVINFTHTVEAVDASQAVGSAINACRERFGGASVDLDSIVINFPKNN